MTCKNCEPPIEPESIRTLPECKEASSFTPIVPKDVRICNEKIIVIQPDECE